MTGSGIHAKTQTIGVKKNANIQNAKQQGYAQKTLSGRKFTMIGKKEDRRSPEELDALLHFWLGIILGASFFVSLVVVQYSLVFVTQPIDKMAPNDAAFFEILKSMTAFIGGVLASVFASKSSAPSKPKQIVPIAKPIVKDKL